jgi:hypothetical protein
MLQSELNDTPVKVRSTLEPQYGMCASDIQDEVAEELRGNVRIAFPDEFIDNLLPGCNDTKSRGLIAKLKQEHYDDKARRWKNFPTDGGSKECALYGPLVRIANAVNKEYTEYRHKDSVNGEWLDTHSFAPESRNKDRPGIEPDIVYVSRPKDAECIQQKLRDDDTEEDSPEALKLKVRPFYLGFRNFRTLNRRTGQDSAHLVASGSHLHRS